MQRFGQEGRKKGSVPSWPAWRRVDGIVLLDKPDGLTLLTHDDIPARIWPLAARKVNGIGPKAAEKLAALGIETVGQLVDAVAKLQAE